MSSVASTAWYFVSRSYTSQAVEGSDLFYTLLQLRHEAMRVDPYTFQMWQTTEIVEAEPNWVRLYSLNGHSQSITAVARANPIFIRISTEVGHGSQRTAFTFASRDEEAVKSVQALTRNLFDSTETGSLDAFLLSNGHLRVQSAAFYHRDSGNETQTSYAHPIPLKQVVQQEPSAILLTIAASLDPVDGQLMPAATVHNLYVDSLADTVVGFRIEHSEHVQSVDLDELFALADRIYRGEPLILHNHTS